MSDTPEYSLVIPVFNEQGNLRELMGQIAVVMRRLGKAWEVLFIDDGSTDASLDVLRSLAGELPEVRYISFAENRGQSAAFAAGFELARGPVIITMDSDLQNDPADIPAMLETFGRGQDMVIGWRAKRKDTWLKRVSSKIGNGLRNRITGETVRDTGCSLKIMRTDMARRLPRFTGMHRFLPTLMKMAGATVAEVEVNHRERASGVSKYGTWDRAKAGAYDLIGVRWLKSRTFTYSIKEDNRDPERPSPQ